MNLAQIVQAWRLFFFAPSSVVPVALFRICWSILVIQILLISLGGDFLFWYGSNSIISFESIKTHFWWGWPRLDFMLLFPASDSGKWTFYFTVVVASFLSLIGLGGRIPVAYTALSIISLHHHNPYNINGGDVLIRLTGFFLMFAPSTEALSVDAWIREKRTGVKLCPLSPPWVQRMLQLQLCIVYIHSIFCKIVGQQWLDGTAVYYALHLQDLMRFPMPWISDSPLLCKFLTWSTLFVETAMFTLVWIREFRYYVLFAAFGLHIGIDLLINLPVFEWISIISLISFVEMRDLDRFIDIVKSKIGATHTEKESTTQARQTAATASEVQTQSADLNGSLG